MLNHAEFINISHILLPSISTQYPRKFEPSDIATVLGGIVPLITFRPANSFRGKLE
jgi:hypothetical protein